MRSLLAARHSFPAIQLISEVLESNCWLHQYFIEHSARFAVTKSDFDQVGLPLIADGFSGEVKGSHC